MGPCLAGREERRSKRRWGSSFFKTVGQGLVAITQAEVLVSDRTVDSSCCPQVNIMTVVGACTVIGCNIWVVFFTRERDDDGESIFDRQQVSMHAFISLTCHVMGSAVSRCILRCYAVLLSLVAIATEVGVEAWRDQCTVLDRFVPRGVLYIL